MLIADYAKERDLRNAVFSTETKNIDDFKNFIDACSVYMNGKKIDIIKLSLTFNFLENTDSDDNKKKIIQ